MLRQRPSSSRILGFVVLTLAFRKEGRVWTGECLELGTATYGRNLERTHDQLRALVAEHLNALEQVGERERFFSEHGIELHRNPNPPSTINAHCPVDDEAYRHLHSFPIEDQAYA